MPEDPPGFLPAGGNYQDLLSYRKSEVIYDFTFRFCEKFLKRGDRTIDQMVQSARSGKQNIAEGSKASVTSTEMELKLTNVARASLEELLLDYQDFLRVRDFPLWEKNSKEALYVRNLGKSENESYETYRTYRTGPHFRSQRAFPQCRVLLPCKFPLAAGDCRMRACYRSMTEELQVLRDIVSRLDATGIAYMLTGSVALNCYAQPRMTRDIDLVVAFHLKDAERIHDILGEDYYVSEDAAREAVTHQSCFNAIHQATLRWIS